jgi:hypothetical protein
MPLQQISRGFVPFVFLQAQYRPWLTRNLLPNPKNEAANMQQPKPDQQIDPN